MAYLVAYQKLQKEYVRQVKRIYELLQSLDQNLLQNDPSDQVEEKLISIGGSFVFMLLFSSFLGLLGLAVGGLGFVALFAMGLVISRGLNRYLFGRPREIKDLSPEEKDLLAARDELLSIYKARLTRLKVKKEPFMCDYYLRKLEELEGFSDCLKRSSGDHLAYKYKFRQSALKKDWLVSTTHLKNLLTRTED